MRDLSNLVVSSREVCRLIGIGRTTLHNWRRDGAFPEPIRLGPRRVGWRLEDVERWLAERAQLSRKP